MVNLSALSSKPINAFAAVPLSIMIPVSLEGVPDVPFPSSINPSVIVVFVEFAVTVEPLTTKLPASVKSLNATLLPVATACPILIAPPEYDTPVPALR